jgi:hypothetical protein
MKQGRAFRSLLKNLRADSLLDLEQEGAYLGAKLETPLTPDGPDVLDGDDGGVWWKGVGTSSWPQVPRLRRVDSVFSSVIL